MLSFLHLFFYISFSWCLLAFKISLLLLDRNSSGVLGSVLVLSCISHAVKSCHCLQIVGAAGICEQHTLFEFLHPKSVLPSVLKACAVSVLVLLMF